MGRSSPVTRTHLAVLLAAASLAAGPGCTMCPDPFDYVGPVPNGSSPQNDFRARSNGIIPLGGSRQPWPDLVSDTPAPAADETGPTLAAGLDEPFDVAVEPAPVSVLADDAAAVAAAPPATVPKAPVAVEPPTSEAPEPVVASTREQDIVAMLLPPQKQPVPAAPPVRESPGWKRRR
jgi:hypothetical protein